MGHGARSQETVGRSIGHPSTRPVDELRSSRSGQVEHREKKISDLAPCALSLEPFPRGGAKPALRALVLKYFILSCSHQETPSPVMTNCDKVYKIPVTALNL